MKQHVTVAMLFVLFVATSAVGEEPQPLPKEIQGEWVTVELEFAGRRPPAEIIRQMGKFPITIKEDKIPLPPVGIASDGKFFVEGDLWEIRCKHDSNTSPKSIDLIFKNDDKEIRMLGIYVVEDKRLKLCWQHDGKGRPKEFKTAKEPSQMLLVLEKKS